MFSELAQVLQGLAKFIYRSGNPAFWHTAARHADQAYDWFLNEDCWVVVHSWDRQPNTKGFVGPFLLAVPKLGGETVRVYGRSTAEVEESEARFLRKLGFELAR